MEEWLSLALQTKFEELRDAESAARAKLSFYNLEGRLVADFTSDVLVFYRAELDIQTAIMLGNWLTDLFKEIK